MAKETHDLIAVGTRIEPELREQLRLKREEADRSEAAEIRQAIRAWVGADAAAPVPASTGEVA